MLTYYNIIMKNLSENKSLAFEWFLVTLTLNCKKNLWNLFETLELLTQFPTSNEWKRILFLKKNVPNWIIWFTEHRSTTGILLILRFYLFVLI